MTVEELVRRQSTEINFLSHQSIWRTANGTAEIGAAASGAAEAGGESTTLRMTETSDTQTLEDLILALSAARRVSEEEWVRTLLQLGKERHYRSDVMATGRRQFSAAYAQFSKFEREKHAGVEIPQGPSAKELEDPVDNTALRRMGYLRTLPAVQTAELTVQELRLKLRERLAEVKSNNALLEHEIRRYDRASVGCQATEDVYHSKRETTAGTQPEIGRPAPFVRALV